MFSKLTVAFSQLSAWIFAFEPSDKSEGEKKKKKRVKGKRITL